MVEINHSQEMEFTQEQADRHNALTKEGGVLIENELIIHGHRPLKRPGFFLRRKLKRAVLLYEEAIAINPEGWSSMWVVGKIHQRLGDQSAAFDWFLKAHRLNPSQPDVVREAGITAMDCGRATEAVDLCFTALMLSPDDLGLQSNLALAYLLAGDDSRADECARVAVQNAPDDAISRKVLAFVRDVSSGRTKRPLKLSDAFPVC